MRGRVLGILAFLALVVPPACGGAADPKGILASSSGNTSSTSSSGAGSSSGGGSGGGSGGSSGVGSSSGSSSSGGSSGLHDAGIVDTGVIDVGPPDLGPPETSTGNAVLCPPKTCTDPDVCCATGTGAGQTPSYRCQSPGHTCNGNTGPGTIISCSSTADCTNGDVCCGANNNGVYEQVSCQQNCTGTAADGATLVTFCDPAANDCPNGGLCQPSQILQGFSVCN